MIMKPGVSVDFVFDRAPAAAVPVDLIFTGTPSGVGALTPDWLVPNGDSNPC